MSNIFDSVNNDDVERQLMSAGLTNETINRILAWMDKQGDKGESNDKD